MVVQVDQALCSGCGLCIELCPEVFAWSGDGKAVVLKQESTSCNLEEISDQCPAEAINL
ncbi:ferredoxin [Candidatus Saganbacteria bacterium CG08_land_8_20_14_0_20_45_16]|uniref:Ferredoxin n=1 Tax=Candidatus Saganbacteria bacterium CG08_land_8_20_14_0_20_45_16 TaxID=2014293 RepID=A0A2H0XYW3_UNCSA|nr:MAG: ferredoxin [Candidatus Saganbacteria bacterium CG08_land_8_20_14_0_20_45_16]